MLYTVFAKNRSSGYFFSIKSVLSIKLFRKSKSINNGYFVVNIASTKLLGKLITFT